MLQNHVNRALEIIERIAKNEKLKSSITGLKKKYCVHQNNSYGKP